MNKPISIKTASLFSSESHFKEGEEKKNRRESQTMCENSFWQKPSNRRPQKCNQPHEILYHRGKIKEKSTENLFQLRWSSEWTNQQA